MARQSRNDAPHENQHHHDRPSLDVAQFLTACRPRCGRVGAWLAADPCTRKISKTADRYMQGRFDCSFRSSFPLYPLPTTVLDRAMLVQLYNLIRQAFG